MHNLKDSYIRNGTEDGKFRKNKPTSSTTYNHAQHIVNESLRECNGLSVDLYRPSEYDKLALSLISPLPNEQDFAINVCMLLSGDIKHMLKLDKHPRILHYLLAHGAVFHERGLKELFTELYGRDREHSINHFWKDVVRDKELHRLADDNYFNELPVDSLEMNNNNNNDWYFDSTEPGLFCLGRTLGTQDFIGLRVSQIANILRNLSFFEENSSVMAKDVTFIRFALLCCSSNWSDLPQAGWEMLANIAEHLSGDSPLVDDILMITTKGLLSDDRAEILGSLNIINAMARSDNNEQLLLTALTPEVFERVCSLLSLHDIMLLVDTLECLYSISSMGDKACNCIVRVRGAIDILVSLITVEAQSYGPKACIQMRVVETIDNTLIRREINPIGPVQPTRNTSTTHMSNRPTPSRTPPAPRPTPAQLLPPSPIIHHQIPIQTPSTITSTVTTTPTVVPVTVNQACQAGGHQTHVQKAPSVPTTPPPSNPRLLAKENEQFALGWLRNTLEVQKGGKVEEAELYKLYINWCSSVGRQGVIAPSHFPRCVRSVFGVNIGPKVFSTENGNIRCYDGICMKNKIGSSVPSPILKAQLCSPLNATVQSHVDHVKVTQRQAQAQARMMQNSTIATNQTRTTVLAGPENKTHSVIMEPKFTPNTNCRINGLRADNSDKSTTDTNKFEENIRSHPGHHPINQKLVPPSQTHVNHQHTSSDGITDEGASNSSTVSSNISKGAEGDISTDSSEGSGLIEGSTQTNFSGSNTFTNKLPNSPKGMKLAELLEKGTDKRADDHLMPAFNGPIRLIEKSVVKAVQCKDVGTARQSAIGQPITTPALPTPTIVQQNHLKRPAINTPSLDATTDQPHSKKPCLNGDINADNKSKENSGVSPSAASLYANLAADILEGETLDEPTPQIPGSSLSETTQQQVRINEQMPPALQPTVATHNLHANRQQILLVGGQQYMVAQPHPALVQHGGQTVLVAQQQAGAKAIFFLRPQPQTAVVVAGAPPNPNQAKVTPMQRMTAKSPPPPLVKLTPSTSNQSNVNKSAVSVGPQAVHSIAAGQQAVHSITAGPQSVHSVMAGPQIVHSVTAGTQAVHSIATGPQAVHTTATGPQVVHAVVSGPQAVHSITAGPQAVHCVGAGTQAIQSVVTGNQAVHSVTAGTQAVHSISGGNQTVHSVTGIPQAVHTIATGTQAVQSIVAGTHTIHTVKGGTQAVHSAAPGIQAVQSVVAGAHAVHSVPHTVHTVTTGTQVVHSVTAGPHVVHSVTTGQQAVSAANSGPHGAHSVTTGTQSIHSAVAGPQAIHSATTNPQIVHSATSGPHASHSVTTGTQSVHSARSGTQTIHSVTAGSQAVHSATSGPLSGHSVTSGTQSIHSAAASSQAVHSTTAGPQTTLPVISGIQGGHSVTTGTQPVHSASPGQQSGPSATTATNKAHSTTSGPQTGHSVAVGTQAAHSVSGRSATNVSQTGRFAATASHASHSVITGPQTVHTASTASHAGHSVITGSQTGHSVTSGTQAGHTGVVSTPNLITGSTNQQGTTTIPTRTPTPKLVETSTSTSPCPTPSPVKAQELVERGHFLCEWRGCMRNFKSGNELYIHSCETHCPRGSEEVQCLWERCDTIKRKRFSLMTHLYDRHCNAEVIKMRRMLLAELVKKDPSSTLVTSSGHQQVITAVPRPPTSSTGVQTSGTPVLQTSTATSTSTQQSTHIARAISRRAVDFLNAKELQEDNEGPITKSIRLTAALIIRNLVVYSTYGRRYLTRYEPHLASVGLSNVESSRTIAHVLFDMSQSCESGPSH